MDELRQRFASLDRVPVPDVWADIERRSDALATKSPTERLVPVRTGPRPTIAARPSWQPIRHRRRAPVWVLAVAVLIALLLVAGAFAVGTGLVRLTSVLPPSPDASLIAPAPSLVAPSLVAPSPQPSIPTDPWVATESMKRFRDNGTTATLLRDGTVLVVGGHGSDAAEWSAERYDPASGRWTETERMQSQRWSGHTATLLRDGRVLVAGGTAYRPTDGVPLPQDGAELYDPATNAWTATGNMTVTRRSHRAVLLPDGRVLAVGGVSSGGGTTRVDLYDPGTGTWTKAAMMPSIQFPRVAAVLPSGVVLVIGDSDRSAHGPDAADLYDPASRTWTPAASPAVGDRQCFTRIVQLADGRVVLLCGSVFDDAALLTQVYDPANDGWTTIQSPSGRPARVAVLLADGRVLVGDRGAGQLFEPATGTWKAAGLPVYAGSGPNRFRLTGDSDGLMYEEDTATVLLDGRVLLTIGPDAFIYDPRTAP
ncbi:MAG TPA: kelch repeat-containing protein [Candidatus Limnocylindrales bacterium]|nr:kelch repeat-containing protein [Candidatus Limnocylindrales bacterium]